MKNSKRVVVMLLQHSQWKSHGIQFQQQQQQTITQVNYYQQRIYI